VAYAQIAGLPPSAGLAAAPGALVAYALLGTSRTLVVSATTATSALSAAAVGPLAGNDVARFAALSAGLAVVVAVVLFAAGGFWRVDEIVRFARLRTSALVFALVALVGVLVLGILPGLVVAALLSLVSIVKLLSRPSTGALVRDPVSGAWGHADRHRDWRAPTGVVAARVDGPLFYANSSVVETHLLALVADARPRPSALVLDLAASTDLDVQALDMLAELADRLGAVGVELRLAEVRAPALELLRRRGLVPRLRVEATLDDAVGRPMR
jgi:MFS superfamily sulfate permease-like transporter